VNGAEDDRVAGLGATAGTALRASDPGELGPYKLLRRLGEGGMGSVYLAQAADRTIVALKVIRTDLAEEPEFRRRFRSEVIRAQQVPPFCTAEVLDADPDHETPYLVVEYVDGPSLSEVVNDRGPLTQANLYGLAIGVATALTAIHGAGVIHRDLKPSNVLLAPGTPKVIDFGIARATEGPDGETRTDQLMGTVAYMAPERLDPAVDGTLTPAADIFAWGAVVTYAATGHVPFAGETSPATAIAILTQKPNLDGVTEPLRTLVRRALAKKPASRPTARELLDELLSNAPRRAVTGTAANGTANAANGTANAANGAPAMAVGVEDGQLTPERSAPAPSSADAVNARAETQVANEPNGATEAAIEDVDGALTSGLALAFVDVTEDGVRPAGATPTGVLAAAANATPTAVTAHAGEQPTAPVTPSPTSEVAAPTVVLRPADATEHVALAGAVPVTGDHRRRQSRWRGAGIFILVICVLASAGAVAGILTGMIKLPSGAAAVLPIVTPSTPTTGPTSAQPTPSPTITPTPSPSASTPNGQTLFLFPAVYDALDQPNNWHPVVSSKYSASCLFDSSGMTVSLNDVTKTVSYRCPGPHELIDDMQLSVNVTLVNKGSCAAIWFRFVGNAEGYVLRVCSNDVELSTHIGSTLRAVGHGSFTPPLTSNATTRIEITADGPAITVVQCDVSERACPHPRPLVAASDPTFSARGVVTLGVLEPIGAAAGKTYKARFDHIQIMTPSEPPTPLPSTSVSAVTPPAVDVSSPPASPSSVAP
jgi:hypothetical protein